MTKMVLSEPSFTNALPVIKQIEEKGFEAFFVGGSVRDALLQKEIHDVDIATSAFPEEIKKIFHKTIDIGIEHGTVMVLFEDEEYEITTFRTESTYQDFRRPDSVTFVRSLQEDLKRRDFTINALAMNKNGLILDYFDGMIDLKEKRIKAVGNAKERFHEDALRMMRAVRFVSQLEFNLETNTKEAIKKYNYLLKKIAVERVHIEFVKLLLGSGREKGLLDFIETGLFEYCPHLEKKENELKEFSKLTAPIDTSEEAWVLLIYYLNLSFEDVSPFLRAWKCSNKELETVKAVYSGIHIKKKKGFLSDIDLYELGFKNSLLVAHVFSVISGEPRKGEIEKRYETLPIHSLTDLHITGHDLIQHFNKRPGKWIGILLKLIEAEVVQGTLLNIKENILTFAEDYFLELQDRDE